VPDGLMAVLIRYTVYSMDLHSKEKRKKRHHGTFIKRRKHKKEE